MNALYVFDVEAGGPAKLICDASLPGGEQPNGTFNLIWQDGVVTVTRPVEKEIGKEEPGKEEPVIIDGETGIPIDPLPIPFFEDTQVEVPNLRGGWCIKNSQPDDANLAVVEINTSPEQHKMLVGWLDAQRQAAPGLWFATEVDKAVVLDTTRMEDMKTWLTPRITASEKKDEREWETAVDAGKEEAKDGDQKVVDALLDVFEMKREDAGVSFASVTAIAEEVIVEEVAPKRLSRKATK